MSEWLSTIIGGLIGVIGTLGGAYYAEWRREKRELENFYSSLVYLMDRLLGRTGELQNLEKVREDLTTTSLHYALNMLWTRIPEKDQELEARKLIFRFLKGGDELDQIVNEPKFRELREWLAKRSKKSL